MKAIRLLVAALALCVLASVPELQAKNDKNAKKLAKIDTVVGGLTTTQATQIDTILTTAQAQVDALTPSDRRANGGAIRVAAMAEVRKKLNPVQQAKFDAMK
jgi:hypothetical protein